MVFLCKSQNVPQMLFRIHRAAWVRGAAGRELFNEKKNSEKGGSFQLDTNLLTSMQAVFSSINDSK